MKTTSGRRASGFLVQGSGGLAHSAPAKLSFRSTRRFGDGVFAGYALVALIAIGYSLVQERRFAAAYGALRSCLAHADSACANAQLERARAIRPADVRLQIADASLAVLLHQLDRAVGVEHLVQAQEKQADAPLGGDVHADLLLLRGDIAWAQGNGSEARDDFNTAKPLLPDPDLAAARVARIDASEQFARDHSRDELATLEQDFSDLFSAAGQGNRDATELRVTKAQEWSYRVADPEARQNLLLAIDAARRASSLMEAQNREAAVPAREAPRPPVRGAYDYSSGYVGSYDAQVAQYRDRLDRFNKERAATDERHAASAARAAAASSDAIDQGKTALGRALEALRAEAEPLKAVGAVPVLGPRVGPARQTFSAIVE